jgi:hypothetical protein
MGMELAVQRAAESVSIRAVLAALAQAGMVCTIMMVDGQLVMPGSEPAAGWRDLRLRTPSGMVTVARRPTGLAVVVFGNADAGLQEAQRRVAEALERS